MKFVRQRKQIPMCVIALGAVVLGAGSATAVTPGESVADLPVAVANPDVPDAVIAALPEVVQQSDVLIDESYVAGMPIVYPDGTPVEGQSEQATRAADAARASCSGVALTLVSGYWGPSSNCGVAVFGSPGYRRGYAWHTGWGINAPRACGQGRGFNSKATATWYGVGCGTSTDATVPWGNVLGNPAFRAKSLSVPLAPSVSWVS